MSQTVTPPAGGPADLARQLRQALDASLTRPASPVAAVSGSPAIYPDPPVDVRGHLLPLSGLLAHKAAGKGGPLGLVGRVTRKVVKVLIRPWLDFQTRFNHGVIEQAVQLHDVQRHQNALGLTRQAEAEAVIGSLRAGLAAATEQLTAATAAIAELRAAVKTLTSGHADQTARFEAATSEIRYELTDAVTGLDERVSAAIRQADELATAAVQAADARVIAADDRADARAAEADARAAEADDKAAAVIERAALDTRLTVNREMSPFGSIAAAGLWFNPAVAVMLEDGPKVLHVTERIVEHIFVHNRIPRPPAKVLDMGCAESTTAIELASLGFEVTGVDLRRLPLEHPNFTMVEANLGHLPFADGEFDIVVCLSTIEHVGLGWYTKDDPTTDLTALVEAVRVLRPGGTFLLTVPFGRAAVTPVHRVYDLPAVERLVAPLRVRERAFAVRDGDAWTFTTDAAMAGRADSTGRVSAVALIVAEKA